MWEPSGRLRGAFQAVDLDDVVLPTALVPGLADAPEAAGDLLPEEEEGFPIDLAGAAVGHAPGGSLLPLLQESIILVLMMNEWRGKCR